MDYFDDIQKLFLNDSRSYRTDRELEELLKWLDLETSNNEWDETEDFIEKL
jgi:hypothetical protein